MKGCCIEYGYETDIKYYLSIVKKVSEIMSRYTIVQLVKKLLLMQETPSYISFSNWLTLVFSNWLIGKEPDAGKDWRREKRMAEDETVGWHHWLDGHELDSWVRKMCWRRDRLPTPVFWPGEFHGLYNPWGHRVGQDWASFIFTYCFIPSIENTDKERKRW